MKDLQPSCVIKSLTNQQEKIKTTNKKSDLKKQKKKFTKEETQ